VYSKALKLKTNYLKENDGVKVAASETENNDSAISYQNYLNKISDYVSGNKLPYAFEGAQNKTSE